MSVVIMDMSSFEIEHNDTVSKENVYSDWTPTVALQYYTASQTSQNRLPAAMLEADTESFLQKMYTYQH